MVSISLSKDGYVGDLVLGPAVTVERKTTVAEIIATLGSLGIGLVVVTDGSQIAGVVSERDIVWALSQGAVPEDVWAADVMSPKPLIVKPSISLVEAFHLMAEHNVRHLVVSGPAPGVVSLRDLIDNVELAEGRDQNLPRPIP